MADIEFSIDDWSGVGQGTPEEVATRALLRVLVAGTCVTRHDNRWSQSVSDRVHVSLYPLAMWMASNWWRLGFEPSGPASSSSYDWRASHEMPAIGGGYLWPALRFEPDGEVVIVSSTPTPNSAIQPVHYLAHCEEPIERQRFQSACTALVETVLARLQSTGCADTALAQLWSEVCSERAAPEASRDRRFEALLHCDPDAVDAKAIAALNDLAKQSGLEAAAELAGALRSDQVPEQLAALIARSESSQATRGKWDPHAYPRAPRHGLPWKRGQQAASAVRDAWGLGRNPVPSREIEGRLELDPGTLSLDTSSSSSSESLPVSLAMRTGGSDISLLLRPRHPQAKRFLVARILGDLCAAPTTDRWHPATDLSTARQKYQRAFAAEFLCPIEGLRDLLDDDRSEDAILEVARHFDVSVKAVEHQIENHLDAGV